MADTGVKGWSPYRDMALQEPPRPNWRWRLLAALIPEFIGASRRWYRWTVGGRWSRSVTKTGTYRYAFRWRRVPRCPGRLHAEVFGAEPLPAGVCVDYSKALLMIDEEVGLPEPMLEGACHEVWTFGVRRG